MLKKILSGSSAALGFLWVQIRKHPKATGVPIWVDATVGFSAWRLQQPFGQLQPILFSFGIVTLAIGAISLWLEKRDQRGTRLKTLIMSATVIFIGLTLGYLGIRPI